MNHIHSTGTQAVYRRTTKGQFAAAAGRADTTAMDTQHRRLLLLVNGYTALDDIARVGHFETQPELLAQDLEAVGLIERAEEEGAGRHEGFRRQMAHTASGPPWHLAEDTPRAWRLPM